MKLVGPTPRTQSAMDNLPSFDVLSAVFEDDDELFQEDPFSPLALDDPMEDGSILTSSFATLMASLGAIGEKATSSNDPECMPSYIQQEEEMSAYVESLSEITKKSSSKKKKKKSHHKKHKRSSHMKKLAAAGVPLPAKPRSVHELFSQHVTTQLTACGIAQAEWDGIISRRWKSIDDSTRAYFSEFADREMAFYKTAMMQYKKVSKAILRSSNSKLKSSASALNLAACNTPTMTMATRTSTPNPEHTLWILPKPAPITPNSSSHELVDNTPELVAATTTGNNNDDTSLLLEPTPLPPSNFPQTIITPASSCNDLIDNNKNAIEHIMNRAPSMAALAKQLGADSTLAFIQSFAQESSCK